MALGQITNYLAKLPAATLAQYAAATDQCILDVLQTGQGHSITGRSMTLANMSELTQFRAEIQAAQDTQGNNRVRRTLAYGGGFTT